MKRTLEQNTENTESTQAEIIDNQRKAIALMEENIEHIRKQKAECPTLRDLFAMAALTGYLSNGRYSAIKDQMDRAIKSYEQADEMLKARVEK